MITNGNHRAPDAPKPASLANARAWLRLLRAAGHELRLDPDGQFALVPPNADLLAGAQPWLKRYRVQLLELMRIDAQLLGSAAGKGDKPTDEKTP